jgi:hypothetical protein
MEVSVNAQEWLDQARCAKGTARESLIGRAEL